MKVKSLTNSRDYVNFRTYSSNDIEAHVGTCMPNVGVIVNSRAACVPAPVRLPFR